MKKTNFFEVQARLSINNASMVPHLPIAIQRYLRSTLIAFVICIAFLLLSCKSKNTTNIENIDASSFAMILNQKNISTIDSVIYTVQLDSKKQKVTELVPAIQENLKNATLAVQSILQEKAFHTSDLLFFSSYDDANKFRSVFLPYVNAFAYIKQKTILRKTPSLTSVLIARISYDTSLPIVAPPHLEYKRKMLPKSKKGVFNTPVNIWIKLRYPLTEKATNTTNTINNQDTITSFMDAWVLLSDSIELHYLKENSKSSVAIFSTLDDENTIWKSEQNILYDRTLSSSHPSTIPTHTGFFIHSTDVPYPYISIRSQQRLNTDSDYTNIAFSHIWPLSDKVFLIPSRNISISLGTQKKIVVQYPDNSIEEYLPHSLNDLQVTQATNVNNILLMKSMLSRYSQWVSDLFGNIGISIHNRSRKVRLEWNMPQALRTYYLLDSKKPLQSIIITKAVPATTLASKVDRIIALTHPTMSHYLFFSLNILSNSAFSLQHIVPHSTNTIASHEDSNIDNTTKSSIHYKRKIGETLIVQGTLEGPIMLFNASIK